MGKSDGKLNCTARRPQPQISGPDTWERVRHQNQLLSTKMSKNAMFPGFSDELFIERIESAYKVKSFRLPVGLHD